MRGYLHVALLGGGGLSLEFPLIEGVEWHRCHVLPGEEPKVGPLCLRPRLLVALFGRGEFHLEFSFLESMKWHLCHVLVCEELEVGPLASALSSHRNSSTFLARAASPISNKAILA